MAGRSNHSPFEGPFGAQLGVTSPYKAGGVVVQCQISLCVGRKRMLNPRCYD